jgi:ACS family D-galactonate transporter-like MFS transporter
MVGGIAAGVVVITNYIDRSNLEIAALVLEQSLFLSPLQMRSLLAAFSWTYALLRLIGALPMVRGGSRIAPLLWPRCRMTRGD